MHASCCHTSRMSQGPKPPPKIHPHNCNPHTKAKAFPLSLGVGLIYSPHVPTSYSLGHRRVTVRLWVVKVDAKPLTQTSFVVGIITIVLKRIGLRVFQSSSSMLVLPRLRMPMIALPSCTTVLFHVSLGLSSVTRKTTNMTFLF